MNNDIRSEYKKEIRRIKNFIKRNELKGFRFENIIPEEPQTIKRKDVNKLKKITPEYMYSKSTALSYQGKPISGLEKVKENRNKGAENGWETRRRKKDQNDIVKISSTEIGTSNFDEDKIVYRQIVQMINECPLKKAREHLQSLLDEEIKLYGEENVMMSLSNTPQEALETASIVLRYDCGHPEHETAIMEMQRIITGTIPTIEEAKQLQEAIDNDNYYNEV